MAEQDELAQLEQMHAQGVLTDAELELARSQVLSRAEGTAAGGGAESSPADAGAADEAGAESSPADAGAESAPADADADADAYDGAGDPTGEPTSVQSAPIEPADVEPSDDATSPPAVAEQPARPAGIPWVAVLFGALALAGIALVIVALVGGGSSGSSSGINVNGIVVITDHNSVYPDDPTVQNGQQFGTGGYTVGKACHALSGFQDIATGANVLISGSDGKQLAATKLKAGVFDLNADCVFGFTATIKHSSSYEIKIGERQPVQYPSGAIANPQLVL